MGVPIWIVVGAVLLVAIFVGSAYANTLSDLEAPFLNALQLSSYGLALALIFAAGLATSLTPCVYPMIATPVGVFDAQQAKTRAHGALLFTLFVLGIATLFTPLGLFAATTGELFGSLLSPTRRWCAKRGVSKPCESISVPGTTRSRSEISSPPINRLVCLW